MYGKRETLSVRARARAHLYYAPQPPWLIDGQIARRTPRLLTGEIKSVHGVQIRKTSLREYETAAAPHSRPQAAER